jgi:hypothetical protein
MKCLLALQIIAQAMMNELADAANIIDNYDTVGTLVLTAAVLPPSYRVQILETLVHLVIRKFKKVDPFYDEPLKHGEPSMYMDVMNRVVDHLDKKGFLDDTKITHTRTGGIPYYAPDMTIREVYQNHINIWSLPRFLWVDSQTFHRLSIEIEFTSCIPGRPLSPLQNYDIECFWKKLHTNIHSHERTFEFHKRLHEGPNTCESCTWCDPERWDKIMFPKKLNRLPVER